MAPRVNELVARALSSKSAIFRYTFVPQALAGFCLVILGYYYGHDHFRLMTSGVHTQGKIVGFKETSIGAQRSYPINGGASPGGGSLVFMPIVEFQNKSQTLRFLDSFGTTSQGEADQIVPVIYDAENPSIAMIDRRIQNWLPWAPTFVLGVFLCLVALKGWLRLWTQKESP